MSVPQRAQGNVLFQMILDDEDIPEIFDQDTNVVNVSDSSEKEPFVNKPFISESSGLENFISKISKTVKFINNPYQFNNPPHNFNLLSLVDSYQLGMENIQIKKNQMVAEIFLRPDIGRDFIVSQIENSLHSIFPNCSKMKKSHSLTISLKENSVDGETSSLNNEDNNILDWIQFNHIKNTSETYLFSDCSFDLTIYISVNQKLQRVALMLLEPLESTILIDQSKTHRLFI